MMATGKNRMSPSKNAAMARLPAGILACVAIMTAAHADPLPHLPQPTNLQQEAAEMTRTASPMVVLFSQNGCSWCDQARTHLVPMSRATDENTPARFRQINLDDDTALVDFSGRQTTQRAFADREKIRFTPTMVVFGASGEQLGDPIVGMRLPDFYGQYVTQAIEKARAQMINPAERTHQ